MKHFKEDQCHDNDDNDRTKGMAPHEDKNKGNGGKATTSLLNTLGVIACSIDAKYNNLDKDNKERPDFFS